MKKWLIRAVVLAAIVAALLLLRLTLFAPEPVPVETVSLSRGVVEETVTNSRAGAVKARRRALLSPEVGGLVVEVPFREGDVVRQGDLLLRLDSSAEEARLVLAGRELEAARAERERSCLNADRAARELERSRALAGEGILSADLLDEIESAKLAADAACRAADATVSRAEAGVTVARTAVKKMAIRAPFAGVVAEVSIEIGEWTTPSPPAIPVPPVIDLLDPSSLFVSAPMDEVDANRIRVGQTARVTVDSHRDTSFPGRVARVAPYVLDIQEQNRTIEVEVELEEDGREAGILPGTSADVEVVLRSRADVLRLPSSALMEGDRVLVLRGDRLEEREIAVGLRNWDFAEVLDGLDAEDAVVTSLDRPEVRAGALAEAAPGS